MGNYAETAPETWGDYFNLRSYASYDERSDIFSFAIIAWRLLVGLHSSEPDGSAFGSLNGPQLRDKIKEVLYQLLQYLSAYEQGVRPVIPDYFNDGLAALLKTCWDLDPSKRPPFTEIVTTLVDSYVKLYPPCSGM